MSGDVGTQGVSLSEEGSTREESGNYEGPMESFLQLSILDQSDQESTDPACNAICNKTLRDGDALATSWTGGGGLLVAVHCYERPMNYAISSWGISPSV
jgi:hypothetical protein